MGPARRAAVCPSAAALRRAGGWAHLDFAMARAAPSAASSIVSSSPPEPPEAAAPGRGGSMPARSPSGCSAGASAISGSAAAAAQSGCRTPRQLSRTPQLAVLSAPHAGANSPAGCHAGALWPAGRLPRLAQSHELGATAAAAAAAAAAPGSQRRDRSDPEQHDAAACALAADTRSPVRHRRACAPTLGYTQSHSRRPERLHYGRAQRASCDRQSSKHD